MKLFKCSVCNYMQETEQVDGPCIKCGAPASSFEELSEGDADKVYLSERTNDILMELDVLSMKIAELCYEGMEIELDVNCLKTFQYANDRAWNIKQLVKAELENHIKNRRW